MRADRVKEECVVVATSAATHQARHFFPKNRIQKYIYMYVQYVETWSRTNGELTLRFGIDLSNQGDLLGTLRRPGACRRSCSGRMVGSFSAERRIRYFIPTVRLARNITS
jgi:hypothetical protein